MGETGDPNFVGVGNWTFSRMIDIKEIVAILKFFHNGRCWYSISVDTWKTGDPNFGRVGNWKIFCTIDIKEMAAIFQFFHNGWHWYSISVDTQKTGDPNLGGVNNWNFSVQSILKKWQPFFNFFIMADADIPHSEIQRQKFCRFSFPNFSIGSVFPVTHPRFHFNMDAWLCLKHFCVVTFLHSENRRHKFSSDSVLRTFPLVQFSPSPILGSFHHLCVATHKTFMRGHLCVVTFLHQWKVSKESAKIGSHIYA